ncbi:MAG TPA: MarR family transcriptional regulator [Gaiellaceae bacterium]|jgi:DNA-binding MarR family transcriptional regulator
MARTRRESPSVDQAQQLANFRVALREFLWRTEAIASESGLTDTQYVLLLLVKGAPDGSERCRLVDISRRLKLSPNSVTGLVRRAERANLVRREPSETDQRAINLRLTEEGERRLALAVQAGDRDRRAFAGALSALLSAYVGG